MQVNRVGFFIGVERVLEMEAVVFVGLQGSGKSSFFRERFFATHVRVSLDLLRTRNRENRILEVWHDGSVQG